MEKKEVGKEINEGAEDHKQDAEQSPEEHAEAIRGMITEAGIAEGSRVIIITKDHPNPNRKISIMRSMQLEESEESEPGFNADSAPMRNVRYDLRNIISIEKAESPQ